MFHNMVNELTLSRDTFKDVEFSPITEQEFEKFLKEATFTKLKGERLGVSFAKRFGVKDRVLSMFSDDQDVIKHIRYCKYVK